MCGSESFLNFVKKKKRSLLEFLESRQQVSDICLQERGDKKKGKIKYSKGV